MTIQEDTMPLSFDMPFDDLKTYTGRNPCPTDFDEFWDRSIADLERIDPAVELLPVEPAAPRGKGPQALFAEYRDLWFTGIGGARVHAKLVRPLGDAAVRRTGPNGKGPAVLQFHGYTGNCGDWQSKLGLAAAGFTVAALDCRGQGGLSEDVGGVLGNTQRGHIVRGLAEAAAGKPEKLLYRAIFLDTLRLARIVMNLDWVDPGRIGAMGGSQGGALTLACVALEPRIARAAPVFPFLSDYRRVWELDLAKDAYAELSEWFRRYDPLHKNEDAVFKALGYIDIQHLARRIKAEVRMFTGLMDMVCPPSTQFAAFNRISSKKDTVIYPDFGHEDLPGHQDKILEFMLGL
jgi:cephalosporin-C deacetylase